jgi:hypothetical protein
MTDKQQSENKEEAIEMTIEEFLAIRKEAGLKIDPETAEVDWCYAQVLDPYGIYPNPPDEAWCVGRAYFARSPDSDVWVEFRDLPEATRDALRQSWKTAVFPTTFHSCDPQIENEKRGPTLTGATAFSLNHP